jgi:hypothetical protein
MQSLIAHCPMCHGRLLAADAQVGDLKPQRLTGQTYYCPSCEMFVEPEEAAAGREETLTTIDSDVTPEDRGRPRASGTNAGGSQRGDLSDQGASQWRRDAQETERNTWKDKD